MAVVVNAAGARIGPRPAGTEGAGGRAARAGARGREVVRERARRLPRRPAEDSPREGGGDDRDAHQAQTQAPAARGVAAHGERMCDGKGPSRPRAPVHDSPQVIAEMAPEQAGGDDGEREVETQHAEPDPDRTVGGGEGHDDVEPSQVDVAVDDGGHDVDGEEARREQSKIAVQARGHDPSQPRGPEPLDAGDAERDDEGEQQQRHEAGAADQEPVALRGGGEDHGSALGADCGAVKSASVGQFPIRRTVPSSPTSRAWCPRSASQAGAV